MEAIKWSYIINNRGKFGEFIYYYIIFTNNEIQNKVLTKREMF